MCNLFGVNSLLSSPAAYMLLAAVFMIPTVWLPDLSALSTLGFLGVTASCTVTATVRMGISIHWQFYLRGLSPVSYS